MALLSSSSGLASENGDFSPDSETLAGENETESLVPLEPERQYYCGCGPFRPRWLQWFARPTVYTTLLCLFVLVESCVVSGAFDATVNGETII